MVQLLIREVIFNYNQGIKSKNRNIFHRIFFSLELIELTSSSGNDFIHSSISVDE